MPTLQISALDVVFPGLSDPALSIAQLVIRPGERVAVTGPSGSGKSTFVNIVTGIERARTGSVAWDVTDLARLGEAARDRWRATHVGLVLQDFHLFPGLSALRNVLLPASLRRLRLDGETRARANLLLERVGLTRPDQPIETMSRGEMQRVAVARALLARPGILVADEPSASLDADSGAAVADLLLDLAREDGSTLIVVSHDERIVSRLDRRLRLVRGRIHDEASPASALVREYEA